MLLHSEPKTYKDGTARVHTIATRDLERSLDEYAVFCSAHPSDNLTPHLKTACLHIEEELAIRATRKGA